MSRYGNLFLHVDIEKDQITVANTYVSVIKKYEISG